MNRIASPTSIFIDLDNTLYDYQAREKNARRDLFAKASQDLQISTQKLSRAYESARAQVKFRDRESASSHSRLCLDKNQIRSSNLKILIGNPIYRNSS